LILDFVEPCTILGNDPVCPEHLGTQELPWGRRQAHMFM